MDLRGREQLGHDGSRARGTLIASIMKLRGEEDRRIILARQPPIGKPSGVTEYLPSAAASWAVRRRLSLLIILY